MECERGLKALALDSQGSLYGMDGEGYFTPNNDTSLVLSLVLVHLMRSQQV